MNFSGKNLLKIKTNFSGLTSADFLKKKTNEPILEYRKGSKERIALEDELAKLSKVFLYFLEKYIVF